LAITPLSRSLHFLGDTFKATDYRTLNYDLATNPEQFNSYYTFSTAYLMQGFLNDSLLQLYPELVTENAKQQLYREHYFSGHNYTVPVTGSLIPLPIRPGRFTGAA
jgi:sphingomyelin phosphodiesterase acid-like 3